jgi:hypothetical protein
MKTAHRKRENRLLFEIAPTTTSTTTTTSVTTTLPSTTTTIPTNVKVKGIALDYYSGERISGNITAIPLENPGNKTTATITNGEELQHEG